MNFTLEHMKIGANVLSDVAYYMLLSQHLVEK
jgi:hypothetical protein